MSKYIVLSSFEFFFTISLLMIYITLWLFYGYQYQERKNVEDLKSQAFYRFIKRTYLWHIFGFGALVYAWGGFPYLVWIMVKLKTLFSNIIILNFDKSKHVSCRYMHAGC